MILKFPRSFYKYSSFFFSKFQQMLLKTNTFQFLGPLLTFYQVFFQIPLIFFQRFTQTFDKITVEVCSNFRSGLLKNFPASF